MKVLMAESIALLKPDSIDLAKRYRVIDLEAATDLVRRRYPMCHREGSVGLQYSFWIPSHEVVAVTKQIRSRRLDWWSAHWWVTFSEVPFNIYSGSLCCP